MTFKRNIKNYAKYVNGNAGINYDNKKEEEMRTLKQIGLALLISLLLGFILWVASAFAEDDIYEKDDVLYIVGHSTQEQIATYGEYYEKRIVKREARVNAEIERIQALKEKQIVANAMRDYLIANSLPLREIADAIKGQRVSSYSMSSVGDINNNVTTNGGTNTTTIGDTTVSSTNTNRNVDRSSHTITNSN